MYKLITTIGILVLISSIYAFPGYGEFWCAEGSTDC